MNIQQKAVFLDMDGTILNHQNNVSDYTKKVIDELRRKGIYVFIATGRSFIEIDEITPDHFEVDGIVCANGMEAYVGEEKVAEHVLPMELVNSLIQRARAKQVYYELFPIEGPRITLKEDRNYVEAEVKGPKPDGVGINEWLSREAAIAKDIVWADKIEDDKYSKFYFFSQRKEHIDSWKNELEQVKQEIDFTTSTSTEHNVEVMVANVNKATGIQYILDHLDLNREEILVIGDSNNDLPMFEFAGHSVAMKNAPDPIKALVDEVTEFTCDEDGVYHYLKDTFQLTEFK